MDVNVITKNNTGLLDVHESASLKIGYIFVYTWQILIKKKIWLCNKPL